MEEAEMPQGGQIVEGHERGCKWPDSDALGTINVLQALGRLVHGRRIWEKQFVKSRLRRGATILVLAAAAKSSKSAMG